MARWRICKSLYLLVFCFLVVISSFFYLPHVHAAELTVCGVDCNHATIQAAVNAANTDDTITVSAGTYASFDIAGKNLTVVGAGGNNHYRRKLSALSSQLSLFDSDESVTREELECFIDKYIEGIE